jgi:hypothetical protein
VVAALLCALAALLINGTTARAATPIIEDDTCGVPAQVIYYWPSGPAAFWFAATYTGGPQGSSGVCTMYTNNTNLYQNQSVDNTAFYYLPINPPNAWNGNYGIWAFVPSVHSTTRNAVYEYWPYGHTQLSLSHPNESCGVNQLSLFNVYTKLCAATLGSNNTFYMCADSTLNCGGFIRLIDATGEPSSTTQVASDELSYCNSTTGSCTSGFGLDTSQSFVETDTLQGNQSLSASAGGVIAPGSFLMSSNAAYILIMQGDGNLVLYGPSGALWGSGTQGNPGAYALMQGDGNLVVYLQGGQTALWSSRTYGNSGAHLVVQCDGNVVIYSQSGPAIWSTGTQTGANCTFE